MFRFDSVEIKTQITCVKILTHDVLIGVGNHIYVYLKQNLCLKSKIHVLQDEQITGIDIAKSGKKIIVYGGCCLKVFNVTDETDFKINEIVHIKESDWILSAKWIQDDLIGNVTITNKVKLYNITNNLQLISESRCSDKCIVYSAYLFCNDYFENLVVLSGTVFSELILWQPFKRTESVQPKSNISPVLKRLKGHKGVIFSIDYQPALGLICSTSDDRSAILWHVSKKCLIRELDVDDFSKIKVIKQCSVNGHSSRVFRSIILDTIFITGGEDSFLCLWNFYGDLLRKIETRQNSPVWALDANEKDNTVIIGSEDGGVSKYMIHRMIAELQVQPELTPKYVGVLKSGYVTYITTTGSLHYCNPPNGYSVHIVTHSTLGTYVVFEISICRTMLALATYSGTIYIYREIVGQELTLNFYKQIILNNPMRILSLHWLSNNQLLTCQEQTGLTLVNFNKEHSYLKIYQLAHRKGKDNWTTCGKLINENYFIVGNRRGDVFLYHVDISEAVSVVKRAHTSLGVTYIFKNGNRLQSLGRDGYLRSYVTYGNCLTVETKNKMPYNWLTKVDKDLLLGFSGENFVIAEFQKRQKLVEKCCNGGHRSWDFYRHGELLSFVYIKDKKICITYFYYKSIISHDIITGYHINNINAINVIKCENDYVLISGGEDTFLRVSSMKHGKLFTHITLKSHLSSIRAIEICELTNSQYSLSSKSNNTRSFLVFTAGGRNQIITWLLKLKKIKGNIEVICEEQYNIQEGAIESETRVMDLQILGDKRDICLFVALSDGNIKIYKVAQDANLRFFLILQTTLVYQVRCILKIFTVKIKNLTLLGTLSTDGMIVFWHNEYPKFSFAVHQSGINCCSYRPIDDDKFLFLTGGDDNAVVLSLFEVQNVNDNVNIIRLDSIRDISVHCAQVTGAHICENNYFITCSIDQRISIFKWRIQEQKVYIQFIQKYVSCIPDIQGLKCFKSCNTFEIFVYGSGLQFVAVDDSSNCS